MYYLHLNLTYLANKYTRDGQKSCMYCTKLHVTQKRFTLILSGTSLIFAFCKTNGLDPAIIRSMKRVSLPCI